MGRIVRSILAVIAGFIAASVVMIVVESINTRVLYPEMGKLAEIATDREAIRAAMASAPAGALLVVIAGWVLGSLAGGFVAGWIGSNAPIAHGLVLGLLLTLAGIVNNLMLPPPAWFWVAALVVFVPAAYAGARLAPSKMRP